MRFATELPQDFKMLVESLNEVPPKVTNVRRGDSELH
jgi:hypothetical protein